MTSLIRSWPLALMILTACASAPKIDYYTLDMTPSGRVGADLNLDVQRFATADGLSGDRILIQATPTRVEYFATDRWVGSVGSLVQQKLTAELGMPRASADALRLSGTVLACGQVDSAEGRKARVQLAVVVERPGARRGHAPVLEKTYDATVPVTGSGTDALAAAISRGLEDIAVEIAEDAADLAGRDST